MFIYIYTWCSLLVIQKLWSLSMFQTIFLPHQHGRSALDTSRTLFLLASTQGVSCRLVMNHLIYMYMFSLIPLPPPPLIYMWVSVCTFMYIYLFSCPSVPAPQLLIFHREYLSWYIVVVYRGVASLFWCKQPNLEGGAHNFFLTRCKMVRSEVFSWVNWIHMQHVDFRIWLDRIYLELPRICSSCLSRHELLHSFV